MARVKVPRIKPLDPLRPGRHTRARQAATRPAPVPAPPAPSVRRSGGTPARAELERRQAARPAQQLGVRETPRGRDAPRQQLGELGRHSAARKASDYGTRNHPPRGNVRRDTRELGVDTGLGLASDRRTGRVGPKQGARAQLAARQPVMGQPKHHPASGLLARQSSYDKAGKATGKARRPASRLPTGDPAHGTPVEAGRRHPKSTGRDFAEMGVRKGGGSFAERFFS